MTSMGPISVPRMIPVRSSALRPACSSADWAATTEPIARRSMRRRTRGASCSLPVAVNSPTCWPSTSVKAVAPVSTACSSAATVSPAEVAAPSPVMTTRRSLTGRRVSS